MAKSFYDFTVTDNKNKEFSFNELRGKTILIVNTASKCGFTPQYKGLESLYEKYKDKGLVILGFPCNQFGNQEPGDSDEIASFCELNFGVTFPLMNKIDVNGKNESPLYTFLKSKAGGFFCSRIKWNFTKFLISPDGDKIKRFSPTTKPESLDADIVKILAK